MPSDPAQTSRSIRFGEDFELDPRAYQLTRAGQPLKLERIPMEVLLLLTDQRGQLVTRAQIAERIWGQAANLDIDNSINGAIRKIRQTLRDDPERPRFIQTVTGRGYRFIAPVLEPPRVEPPEPVAGEVVVTGRWSRTGTWLVVGAVLMAIAVAQWWLPSRTPRAFSGKAMLAVLPFQNLTGDAAQEYFSDGLTEEMITALGNRDPEHLGVIARTSVMQYKHSEEPLDRIGRALGVEYILSGSVRREASQVRVTAQLIRARDREPIWAREYNRAQEGVLTLQGEIAQEIADEIESSVSGKRPVASADPVGSIPRFEAYDLYLKGEYFFNRRAVADLEAAIGYFEQAAARDSGYARVYAALADAYALLAGYSQAPPEQMIAKARAAALRALALDPSLPEAHAALALIVQNRDWDWQTAEKEFRRAIELNPNYATAHHWYAEHLMWRGRFEEALRESERARLLDPLSLIIAADNAAILYYSRQYDRAIEKWQSVLEINPDFSRAQLIIGALIEKGRYAEAAADLRKWRRFYSGPVYWSWLAYLYGHAGQTAQAHEAIAGMLQTSRREPVQAGVIAAGFAGQGDKEQALVWLERARAEGSNEITTLKVNPVYDGLRGDPRFQRLLDQVGLAK